MNLADAQSRFIHTWGALGSQWGINRTMAQIHALLLISTTLLSTDDIMDSLRISRGNANMNIRTLVDWGLIYKEVRPGIRREFFRAEKNILEVTKRITAERRKRELEPLMQALNDLRAIDDPVKEPTNEFKHFKRIVDDIYEMGQQAGNMMDLALRLNQSDFLQLLKLIPDKNQP